MSVLKSKRKPSQFEVFHHLNKLRKGITDLLLRDFGYNAIKSEKRLERRFGSRSYEELTDIEKQQYDRQKKKQDAFDEWFIESERNAIIDCLRSIGEQYLSYIPGRTGRKAASSGFGNRSMLQAGSGITVRNRDATS